jgi:hypothetical protein
MNDLPDAPWIRDAELNGYPEPDAVKCPVCGEECDDIYEDRNGDVCGCDQCMRRRAAWDWWEEQDHGGDDW